MAKILLLNPTYRGRADQKSIPHGLLAVGSVLRNNGHQIRLIDFHLEGDSPETAFKKIAATSFDIVGISGISTSYYFWKAFVRIFRERLGRTIPIMAGGSVAATMPVTFLDNVPVDAVCTGDGEPTVNALVDALLQGTPLDTVQGIAFKRDAEVIVRPGLHVVDMDAEVPLPAYDLIDMPRYRWKSWDQDKEILEIVMFSSRGCPYACFFCSRNFGRRFTQHTVGSVIAHIRHVVSRFRPERLCFSDELFTFDRKWVLDFLSQFKALDLGVPFRINSRVNTVDREILQALKDANCSDIGFGIESGSDVILKEMNKKVSAAQNLAALKTSKAVGLNATSTIVLGMPSETDQTIDETRRFLIEADTRIFGCFFATAYPGSDLFDYAIAKGYIQDVDSYMQHVDNADNLVVNYTRFTDEELKSKMIWLKRDVAYAWHRKRGWASVIRYRLRPLFTAAAILRNDGPWVLASEIKAYLNRLRYHFGKAGA
ncbi:MAG: radical SAM protein [Pseudomonadota bacterium]